MQEYRCHICGTSIDADAHSDILRENISWTAGTNESPICTTDALKDHHFTKSSTVWSSLCRAVYGDIEPGNPRKQVVSQFKISGAFQLYQWMEKSTLILPTNPDLVFSGARPDTDTEIISVPKESICRWGRYISRGTKKIFLYHERCFTVLLHIFGSDVVLQNMTTFMTAMYHVELDSYTRLPPPVPEVLSGTQGVWEAVKQQRILGNFIQTDPWRDANLESAIRQAKLARCPAPGIRVGTLPTLQALQLPINIQMLMIDNLKEHTDVANAIEAFCWQFPDAYWRRRIPKHLIFEYSSIEYDDLDWADFHNSVHSLLPVSKGLRKRQIVIEFLEFVKVIFQMRIKAENMRAGNPTENKSSV